MKNYLQKSLILAAMCWASFSWAQGPQVEVDINFAGRQEGEVHEPGYSSWVISAANNTFEESGVTFTFDYLGGFNSGWYKAGVQTPHFARLINDGLVSAEIELKIEGLATGKHSLLSFHNSWDNPENQTFTTVDVYVNDQLVHEKVVQSKRELKTENAATIFVEFEAVEGEPVKIRYIRDVDNIFGKNGIYLNGFKLNVPDSKKQARFPYPGDLDLHAHTPEGSIELRWASAPGVISHNVYFGTSEQAVFSANTSSSEFLGNQQDTSKLVNTPDLINYYWRVDEITATDTTRGDIWSFIPRRVAFPGAEGYGGFATGGRGGKVVYVTNLEDDGPGSFRHAAEDETGPRTIVFAVSGLISLSGPVRIRDSHVTVAGQTAPGKGICFRWAPMGFVGDELIVQHIRNRVGYGVTYDGMGLTGANNSILDHCSISWSIDEAFSSRNAKNITLQRTLISEALNLADHDIQHSEHGYAGSILGSIGSFHHNLLAHCNGRNWSIAGVLDGDNKITGRMDIFNQVVYNWGSRTTDGFCKELNFVNNYYKPGASTSRTKALAIDNEGFPGPQSYYVSGNIMPGHFDETETEKSYSCASGFPNNVCPLTDKPNYESHATIHTAKEAYKLVLSDVGCTQPVFDDHDIRIIQETLDGTYTYRGSKTGKAGFPDRESDVGGWEEYPGYRRAENWDSDLDGLPDWWELAIGTNPNSDKNDFSDANADPDNDWFTNLEEYLHWMSTPHYFLQTGDTANIDLEFYSKGFTNQPAFAIASTENGTTRLDGHTAQYLPTDEGIGKFQFTVTDGDGTSLTRDINFYVGTIPVDSAFGYTYFKDRSEKEIVKVGDVKEEPTDPTDTTKVLDNTPSNGALLWPNPAGDRLNLVLNDPSMDLNDVYITDLSGKRFEITAFSRYGNDTMSIDISSLNPGIYLLHSNTQSNQPLRFIKK